LATYVCSQDCDDILGTGACTNFDQGGITGKVISNQSMFRFQGTPNISAGPISGAYVLLVSGGGDSGNDKLCSSVFKAYTENANCRIATFENSDNGNDSTGVFINYYGERYGLAISSHDADALAGIWLSSVAGNGISVNTTNSSGTWKGIDVSVDAGYGAKIYKSMSDGTDGLLIQVSDASGATGGYALKVDNDGDGTQGVFIDNTKGIALSITQNAVAYDGLSITQQVAGSAAHFSNSGSGNGITSYLPSGHSGTDGAAIYGAIDDADGYAIWGVTGGSATGNTDYTCYLNNMVSQNVLLLRGTGGSTGNCLSIEDTTSSTGNLVNISVNGSGKAINATGGDIQTDKKVVGTVVQGGVIRGYYTVNDRTKNKIDLPATATTGDMFVVQDTNDTTFWLVVVTSAGGAKGVRVTENFQWE